MRHWALGKWWAGAVMVAGVAAGENFGLREPQAADLLPRSKAEVLRPVRRGPAPEVPLSERLVRLSEGEWRVAAGWKLAEADAVWPAPDSLFDPAVDTAAWYPATVPGTVLATLVDQGVCPDPYYGLNNLLIPESLCRKEWLYRTVFDAPAHREGQRVWLCLNGANYRAAAWLNGVKLGEMSGAFERGAFDATRELKPAGNVLAVRVSPPPNPGIPHEESARTGQGPNGGQLCLDGPTFISSEGWDWVPGIRDRNTGLWQDVRLRVTGDVVLSDPQVLTDLPLPATDRAAITVRVTARNVSGQVRKVTLALEIGPWPGGVAVARTREAIELAPGETRRVAFSPKAHPELTLANPRLWWPNGYGEQALYDLRVEARFAEGVSDAAAVRFGVRELSYTLAVDAPGRKDWRVELSPLSAYAGGKPLVNNLDRREVEGKVCVPRLCPGADLSLLKDAPDAKMGPYLAIRVNGVPIFCRGGNWGMDDALKRVSRVRLEPALRLHREAGFTMVRNWTGESTEPEFFELCDELGLLVWNDFWYSTQGYNLEPNDHALFLANVRDTVRRYRNHPSLVVWCPRNEGWANEQLEPQLAALLVAEDPSRYYQGNSRLQNLRPSGPWGFHENVADYFTKMAFGFSTELGSFAVPTFETLKTFVPPEDLWPIGDVWYYHDFHAEQNQAQYRKAIAGRYGEPTDAEAFCRRAQQVNYETFRGMFEAWNSRLWENASGLLLWMSHPAWPSMIWQLYSYDFETTGAYFGAKKACEPVHIQLNAHDRKVVALNLSRQPLEGLAAAVSFVGLDGREVWKRQRGGVSVAANAKAECFVAELPPAAEEPVLARVTLADAEGKVLSLNDYWLPGRSQFLSFARSAPQPLEVKAVAAGASRAIVRVTNGGEGVAAGVRLQLTDAASGARILPAYFGDGWFNLLPGETREVALDGWAEGVPFGACRVNAAQER